MSNPRFFCDSKLGPGAFVELPPNAAVHATRVLRLQPGARVRLFNGDGHDYGAELVRVGKDHVSAKILDQHRVDSEAPFRATLAQAISAGDRMDYTLQKSVELGVRAIQPLSAERSVVKLSGERSGKRVQHWQNVVVSACEQSGRAFVPQVANPVPLLSWLAMPHAYTLKLMLSPDAQRTLHDFQPGPGEICLLTGCEGGFSAQEMLAAEQTGFIPVRLGPRVLRTETAALAALAAMQTLWGDY